MYRNLVNLTSSTSTLLQVGFRGPNSGIIGHVIMRCKQLHFGLAAVNDKNDIINGDRCLSNVGAQDDLQIGFCVINFFSILRFSLTRETDTK